MEVSVTSTRGLEIDGSHVETGGDRSLRGLRAANNAATREDRLKILIRKRLVPALLRISYYCGISLLSDVFRRGRVQILIYHGIPTREHFTGVTNHNGYNIPVREFERHLVHLKKRCHVVSLSDMLAGRNWSGTKTNVVLTFDDGYENNYSNAFRLLMDYEFPATFALPTRFVCEREPLWNDIVEYAVTYSRKSHVHIKWGKDDLEWTIDHLSERVHLYNWLMHQCVTVDQTNRHVLLDSAVEALGMSPDLAVVMLQNEDYRPLTQEQITEMVESGLVEFSSHSVHHYLLSRLEPSLREAEFRESKRQIEAMTGLPCTSFTLPGGAYDSEILDEAFRTGYECVLTSDIGPVVHGNRIINRNNLLSDPDIYRFVDVVHGPVSEMIDVARRMWFA